MKKVLRLSVVLDIKKYLERTIVEQYKQSALDTYYLDRLEKQLVIIKLAVQRANRGRHCNGRTNNYYIYKFSTLMDRKKFYTSGATSSKVVEKIREIDQKLTNISNKLSKFNSRRRVLVSLDKSLDLLKEIK